MKNKKIVNLITILAAGCCLATMIGCGSTKVEDKPIDETEKTGEAAGTQEAEEKPEQALAENEQVSSEPETVSDDHDVYVKFLNDELKLDGRTYSEIFSFVREDFDMEPVAFYYDVDEDGKDELLVSTVFYGYNIYDVRDGELLLLDCGDGTAAACGVYKGNGHVYVSHSDFTHAGRQMLTLTRYNGSGEIVETIEINAEYWESEDDMYDENSDFTYNGSKITMQEYEDYMNALEFIDPESEDAKPAP